MASGTRPIRLANERLAIEIATAFGPRITSFAGPDARNVLAELGNLSIHLEDGQRYLLRGGHRLWVAPEIPEITYEPDDAPVAVAEDGSTVTVTQAATLSVGIEKTLRVTLHPTAVEIIHALSNRGDVAQNIAPWAITQLPPGGTAVMPLPVQPTDAHGLQPNASIVLWPYSGVADSPFTLDQRMVIIDTDRAEATKVGAPLARGWLAYLHTGTAFVKFSRHDPVARYLDMGASGQVYAGPDFTELETLGPQQVVPPGGTIEHRETWKLYHVEPTIPPARLASELGLD